MMLLGFVYTLVVALMKASLQSRLPLQACHGSEGWHPETEFIWTSFLDANLRWHDSVSANQSYPYVHVQL